MQEQFNQVLLTIKQQKPLIHCLVGAVSANLCANGVLSMGARPIMAEHPKEVADITKTAGALLINTATLTAERKKAMKIAAKTAKRCGVPIVMDVVGVCCSALRRKLFLQLIRMQSPTVIKGNYAEIMALYDESCTASGVDSTEAYATEDVASVAAKLALRHHAVILASGQVDIITNGKQTVLVKNGTLQLSAVTGTGCLLGAVCAVFLTRLAPLEAAAFACACLGICGELAETKQGNGSFAHRLLDHLSVLNQEEVIEKIKMETVK